MTFLPIVERELRVASRRRSTYLGRLAGAVIGIAFGGWILMAMRNAPPGQLGQILFILLTIMLFVYSVAAGARITADCLSEEKREGTLGLLFLTDLKGYDIVSGKLAASSLNTFYGLLSAFPILAISLLMGGVTSTEFWRVSLVATNLLFFSMAAGMFASALCREERKATSLALLLIFFMLGATPLIELGLHLARPNWNGTTGLLPLSPAFSCFGAFGAKMRITTGNFWVSVALTQLYSWLFLALASFLVPRSWQDGGARKPLLQRNFWQMIFRAAPQTQRRTKLLEINPFLWLAGRDPAKAVSVWIILALAAIAWFWAALKWPKEWLGIPTYIMTALALHALLKFWVASEACSRFVEDRKSGALELLLSTPLSVEGILRGQRLALFRQFAGPVVFVLSVDFVFLMLGIQSSDLNHGSESSLWVLLWLVGAGVFVMDLIALSWVSMWAGMVQPKVNRASGAALSRILVLPWVAFVISITFFGTVSLFARTGWDGEVVLLYWAALAVINNFIFINWAKRSLNERFRDIATQRFDPKKTRWSKSTSTIDAVDLPPVVQQR